jgi:hypothetical protein
MNASEIEVAERKSAQVIFTTHSNDALEPLPSRAIWAAYNGEVLQGKLDIKALRTITGQIDARLAIFVEDDFAELMITTALRHYGDVELDAVKIHGMGGASPAIAVNDQHNSDPTATFPSVCVIDADKLDRVDPGNKVFALPGDREPESYVLDKVAERLDELAARLTVSMQLPSGRQEDVKRIVRERMRTNRDRHVIFRQIGDDLDFTSEFVVMSAFLSVWAQEYSDEVRALVDQFGDDMPRKV